jgi:CPA2 family monovalent cation:H+ antiporter-2
LIASRWSLSSIPLYLLAGLVFGNGCLAPLRLSKGFVELGAEIGVLLLLFMLGLEYSGEELKRDPGCTWRIFDRDRRHRPGQRGFVNIP